MPILDVEIVGLFDIGDLAQPLATVAAEIFKTGPGKTWVKVRVLPGDQYAENSTPTSSAKPVFVSVLLGSKTEVIEKARFASEIAAKFSSVLKRPTENIHVLFEPAGLGRIAFGGRLKNE